MLDRSRKDFIMMWGVYVYACVCLLSISVAAIPLLLFRAHIHTLLSHSQETPSSLLYNAQVFNDMAVTAKAYIVYDVTSGHIIAEHNSHAPYPLASITKVMTALTALHVASSTTPISINKYAITDGLDLGLKHKQVWKLDALLMYTLVFSSNDGAEAIADGLLGRSLFVREMNEYARSLGLSLVFTQPAGLDVGDELGGKGSAYDVARMVALARMIMPEVLDATTKKRVSVPSSTGQVIGIPNTNQHVNEFVGIEASKTGFTDSAGGNLVLSVDVLLGHPVIIVVLGSTKEDRFTDAYTLYGRLIKSIQ